MFCLKINLLDTGIGYDCEVIILAFVKNFVEPIIGLALMFDLHRILGYGRHSRARRGVNCSIEVLSIAGDLLVEDMVAQEILLTVNSHLVRISQFGQLGSRWRSGDHVLDIPRGVGRLVPDGITVVIAGVASCLVDYHCLLTGRGVVDVKGV